MQKTGNLFSEVQGKPGSVREFKVENTLGPVNHVDS